MKTCNHGGDLDMLRVPVLSWNRRCVAAGEDSLGGKPLPPSYMSEYSVLGFFAEDPAEAVRVLQEGGFSMEKQGEMQEVLVEGHADLQRIAEVLWKNGVRTELADVVDGLYQG